MLSMEQVIQKTQEEVKRAIQKIGSKLPVQEKEEITQKVVLKFIEKYLEGEIDKDRNWEGLIGRSVRGYVRNHKRDRKNEMALLSSDFDQYSIEDLCDDRMELNQDDPEAGFSRPINWDLLQRLCSTDKELKVFVLFKIFEFSLNEINELFGRSSEKRIADMYYDFMAKLMPVTFDNPNIHGPQGKWMRQVLFALGICNLYGLEDIDQEIGWGLEPFIFDRPPKVDTVTQITFDFMSDAC